jgi:hypothetical protein
VQFPPSTCALAVRFARSRRAADKSGAFDLVRQVLTICNDAVRISGRRRPLEPSRAPFHYRPFDQDDRRIGRSASRVRRRPSCRCKIDAAIAHHALARIMALRFEGHRPVVVAIDGQPCDPHEPERGRLLLGLPSDRRRARHTRRAGAALPGVDDFYDGLSYWLTQFAYEDKPPVRAHPLEGSPALLRNPLPELDLATAGRHALTLQGGMMSGSGMGMGMQGMEHGATWAINHAHVCRAPKRPQHPCATARRPDSAARAAARRYSEPCRSRRC